MTTETISMIQLDDSWIAQAMDLLQITFDVDGGMQDICRGKSEELYQQRLRDWFAATLRMQLHSQQMVLGLEANGRLCAIAMLAESQQKTSPRAMLNWTWNVGRTCGLGVVSRTVDQDRQRRPYLPSASHLILEFIAVAPEWQGNGLAHQLFDAIHQHAVDNDKIVWLETTRTHNVPIFEHFGYKLINQNQKNGVDYFFMIKA